MKIGNKQKSPVNFEPNARPVVKEISNKYLEINLKGFGDLFLLTLQIILSDKKIEVIKKNVNDDSVVPK
jgi:hypothetical protein